MKSRFVFKCWNCKREFSLFKEITIQQTLIVPCPFCNKEALVELEPYRKNKKKVMRGDSGEGEALGYEFEFPEVIPTQKPE